MTCSDTVFRHAHKVFVTDTDEIITTDTHVIMGSCLTHSKTELSDLIFSLSSRSIPSWSWTSHYLINVDGRTYLPRLVKDHPYIKGLYVQNAYVKHLVTSMLYVPFSHTRVNLSAIDATTPTDTLTGTVVIPFTGDASRLVVFMAGQLVQPTDLSTDGVELTITLSPLMLSTVTAVPGKFIYPTITTVGELLDHPGSFILVSDADLTFTFTPVGVSSMQTTKKEPMYGAPSQFAALAYTTSGEILPYIYKSTKLVRARFCSPEITHWLTIE